MSFLSWRSRPGEGRSGRGAGRGRTPRFDELSIGRVLGRGRCSEVRAADWAGREVAAKVIFGDEACGEGCAVGEAAAAGAALEHPNLLCIHGLAINPGGGPPLLITELCPFGDLSTFLADVVEAHCLA